jgi:probable F420-dependent oxidoreductase
VLGDYLDELDAAGVPSNRRVIGALGPRMLNLAARRSAGAHPFLTTPEHTRRARAVLGDEAYLAPEQAVVLSTEADEARAVGRNMIAKALGLVNHVNNWKRLGFTEADLAIPGSDRLIDAVVAHGSADDIAYRLNQHLEAGADHVAIRVVGGQDKLLPTLAALSEHLNMDVPRSAAVAT